MLHDSKNNFLVIKPYQNDSKNGCLQRTYCAIQELHQGGVFVSSSGKKLKDLKA
jgi:hypothetical protein